MAYETRIVRSPWTPAQVRNLQAYQASGVFHDYTCAGDGCSGRPLIPTENGWICSNPQCDYTQDWAHEWTTRPEVLANIFRPDL